MPSTKYKKKSNRHNPPKKKIIRNKKNLIQKKKAIKKKVVSKSTTSTIYNDIKDLFIPKGVAISGSIITRNNVLIEGEFHGNLTCKTIEVMKNGLCTGEANVTNAFIFGKINMHLRVKKIVKLGSKSAVEGIIFYDKNIDIDKGSIVHAKLMPKKPLLMLTDEREKINSAEPKNNDYLPSNNNFYIKDNLNNIGHYSLNSNSEETTNPRYRTSLTDNSKKNKEIGFDKIIKSIFSK